MWENFRISPAPRAEPGKLLMGLHKVSGEISKLNHSATEMAQDSIFDCREKPKFEPVEAD